MGLFDVPGPLFDVLDRLWGLALPPVGRLVLWAILGAALSMALYYLFSAQRRIGRIKAEIAVARQRLNRFDGELGEAWPLIGGLLKLSLRHFAVVLWPAVLASLPVLCLIIWLSSTYGYDYPRSGAEISLHTVPGNLTARWVSDVETTADAPAEAVRLPRIVVTNDRDQVIGQVALSAPIPTLHERRWWNFLIANPAGYLPTGSPIERIDLDLPRQEFVGIGPSWLRTWEATFFVVLLLCSIGIKVGFRVH